MEAKEFKKYFDILKNENIDKSYDSKIDENFIFIDSDFDLRIEFDLLEREVEEDFHGDIPGCYHGTSTSIERKLDITEILLINKDGEELDELSTSQFYLVKDWIDDLELE